MARKEAFLFVFLLSFALVTPHQAEARDHAKIVKVRVRFLATSWVIRNTWGQNEDTYLAEIVLPSRQNATLIRLIDEYPNTFPSLSKEALTSKEGTALRLRQDTDCEIHFKDMALRAAPGDMIAILPMPMSYQPKLAHTPAPDEILLCYRTVRK